MPRNKFNAQNTEAILEGASKHKFPSKLECCTYLKLLEQAEKTSAVLKMQVPIQVKPPTKVFRSTLLILDFSLSLGDKLIYVESKGTFTIECLIKYKFLEFLHPHIFRRIYFVCYDKDVERNRKKYKQFNWFGLSETHEIFRSI